MKKTIFIALLLTIFCTVFSAAAAPDFQEQIKLIAANADLWKKDVDNGLWGYTVTDLDRNGRLEIIAASVQGSGFYTYINAYEVNEAGTGLTELAGLSDKRTDSLPDIMVSSVPVYYDRENNRYYYIFDDMIRNGMAEYYENKRAVSIVSGKWEEIMLANKTTLYADADHYSITCTNSAGEPISEAGYNTIAETIYGELELSKACLNWQMTDNESFAAMTLPQLIESLTTASDSACTE